MKQTENFEAQLFKTADKLRKNIDADKHIVLGLVFLKYISDSFDTLHNKLKEKGEDYEDKDQYLAENIFWVANLQKQKTYARPRSTSPAFNLTDGKVAFSKGGRLSGCFLVRR